MRKEMEAFGCGKFKFEFSAEWFSCKIHVILLFLGILICGFVEKVDAIL
jgi:hypothetical protein